MQRPTAFLLFCLSVLLVLGYQNCGDSFQALEPDNKIFAACARVSPIVKATPTPPPEVREKKKVDRESFKEIRSSAETNKAAVDRVNASEKISVALNANCLLKTSKRTLFSQGVKVNQESSTVVHHVVTVSESLSLEDLEEQAKNDSCVVSIAKESKAEILTSVLSPDRGFNDTRYSDQTYMPKINHAFSFLLTSGIQDEVTVAVIDPLGVDILHHDLRDHIWQNPLEALNGDNGIDDDGNGYVDDINGYNFIDGVGRSRVTASHGTYIAGFLAAVGNNNNGIAGVLSSKARIMVLQAGGTADVANSFRYAADKGAKVIVISMSTTSSDQMREAIEYAISKGATVFAAAGNSGPSANSVVYPALFSKTIPGVIAVGMTDANPASDGVICNDSSRDADFVLGAPGCDTGHASGGLLSTWGDASGQEHNGYNYNRGTSFAAPIAAGAGALAYAFVRDTYGCELSPAQVETLVKDGAKPFASLSAHFKDGKHVDLLTLHSYIQSLLGSP